MPEHRTQRRRTPVLSWATEGRVLSLPDASRAFVLKSSWSQVLWLVCVARTSDDHVPGTKLTPNAWRLRIFWNSNVRKNDVGTRTTCVVPREIFFALEKETRTAPERLRATGLAAQENTHPRFP